MEGRHKRYLLPLVTTFASREREEREGKNDFGRE